MKHLLPLSALITLLAAPALACDMHHAEHAHAETAAAVVSPYQPIMERMHSAMNLHYSGDADADFARGMIPHHRAAIEMAEVLLEKSQDETLRLLARRIIFFQEQEIDILRRWLWARGEQDAPSSDTNSPAAREYKAAMDKMHHAMMDVRYTGDMERDFVNGMIPHHQGAIDMAETLLTYGNAAKAPEFRKMAWDIIRSQEQEIALMKRWLEAQK